MEQAEEKELLLKGKKRALRLLERKDYTRKELKERLSRDGYSGETIEQILEYLDGFHYLSDVRVAGSYIRCRMGGDEFCRIQAVHGALRVVAGHAGLLRQRAHGLEMQVREVGAVSRADGADLLPSAHCLSGAYLSFTQVCIEGLNNIAAARQAVGEHDDIAPAGAGSAAVEY